jgi:hypothetical protein
MVTIIEALIEDRRPMPLPRPGAGMRVAVPALLAAKIALHNEMLKQRVNKAELGRRLNQHLPQFDRLIDVHRGSKLDQLEAAFRALGKRIEIRVSDAVAQENASKAALNTKRAKGRLGVHALSPASNPQKQPRDGAHPHQPAPSRSAGLHTAQEINAR